MFANLVIGTVLMVVNLGIQVFAVSVLVGYVSRRLGTGEL